eukprot:TRINITY_DN12484_c0_g1_i5.p1 TRINITY_DN12484_c0_g1~~TRINITY_DN12484_c0_g1_i5.p1  ORF type:complete len:892 (-),score=268.22 TRINITY_DN12484_c0_g1_i5:184-2859(-)
MGRDKDGVRRRGEIVTERDTKHSDKSDKTADSDKTSIMSRWCPRLFSSYRVLILFSLVLCILQFLVGISFFSTFSHRTSAKSGPSDEQAAKEKLQAPPEPKILSSSATGLSFPCNITGREAVSAINRATTRGCKQEIVDLVCDLEKGEVYPTILKRTCPGQVDNARQGKHVGCFKDSLTNRLLQGYLVKLKTKNSPSICTEVCTRSGFSYAGVQYGFECFCGNTPPPPSSALEQSKCGTPCPGSQDSSCGGYLAVDVFETGLTPLAPPKLGLEHKFFTGAVHPVSPQPPVKLVYLLTVAGRASRQVYRLIRQVYSPDHYVLIHVDSRQEFMHRELEILAKKLPNLRMVKSRFSTIWGGASLLAMLLSAMQELVEMKDWPDWDFVLNLSESDYPVKTQEELVTFLSTNRGNNFVKGHGREPDKFIKKQGLDKTFYECDTHMWRLGPRTLPLGVQIDGGSDWICLNREFATHVIQSQDELLVGLKKIFSHTLLPAESFFHTVLRNSEFCQTYIDNNLHLTNWKRKIGCKCQYKAVVDWCGCSPNDFLPEDWSKLEGTRPRQLFFARKFEPIVHQGVLNKVEEWTKNITIEESHAKHSYWQNVYHAADSKPAIDVSSLGSLVEEEVKHLAIMTGKNLELKNIETISTYSFRDKFQGFLVYFKVINVDSEEASHFEVQVQYRPKLTMSQGVKTRLEYIGVGTEFDPKELIFRNYLNLINQHSKPVLKVTFSEGQTEIVKFGWFDPNFDLVSTSQIQFNDTSGKDSVGPVLKSPLIAGIWTVVGVSKGHMVAKEQFLVNPSEDVDKDIVASNIAITDAELEQFVQEEKNSHVNNKIQNQKEAAEFMNNFYEVLDRCSKEEEIIGHIAKCSEAVWSSHYPDPKSQILGVDSQTGKLI